MERDYESARAAEHGAYQQDAGHVHNGESEQQSSQPPKHKMSRGQALAYLAFLGLASPFLELESPLSGVIGLVILFVGIQIAWKMTAGPPVPEISGPY